MTIPLMDTVAQILEQEDLDCVVIEEGVAVKTAMARDEDFGWTCHIEIATLSDEINALVIFSRPFEPLPDDHLLDTLKLINRINANLMAVGSFEIDLDQDLTLRTGLVYAQESELSGEVIAHAMFINWAEIERYLPAVLEVSRGGSLDAAWAELTA